jgi:hypothetical protein
MNFYFFFLFWDYSGRISNLDLNQDQLNTAERQTKPQSTVELF